MWADEFETTSATANKASPKFSKQNSLFHQNEFLNYDHESIRSVYIEVILSIGKTSTISLRTVPFSLSAVPFSMFSNGMKDEASNVYEPNSSI